MRRIHFHKRNKIPPISKLNPSCRAADHFQEGLNVVGGSANSLLGTVQGGQNTATSSAGALQTIVTGVADSATNGHDAHEWLEKQQGKTNSGDDNKEAPKEADSENNKPNDKKN